MGTKGIAYWLWAKGNELYFDEHCTQPFTKTQLGEYDTITWQSADGQPHPVNISPNPSSAPQPFQNNGLLWLGPVNSAACPTSLADGIANAPTYTITVGIIQSKPATGHRHIKDADDTGTGNPYIIVQP